MKFDEPFKKLFNQGIILGEDHEKMSKSRGNVVNPDEQISRLGADTVRTYLMFVGPWDQGGIWDTQGIRGISRWFNRLWDLSEIRTKPIPQIGSTIDETNLTRELHKTIKKVHEDIESFQFNTAIAAMMTLTNLLQSLYTSTEKPKTWDLAYDTLLTLLSPIAPHLSEEIWELIGNEYSVHQQSWPVWEERLLEEETFTLIVQINGKVRDRIELSADTNEEDAIEAALGSKKIQLSLNNQTPKNSIYVPKRLINFVTG